MFPNSCHAFFSDGPWQPPYVRHSAFSILLVRFHATPFLARFPVAHPIFWGWQPATLTTRIPQANLHSDDIFIEFVGAVVVS